MKLDNLQVKNFWRIADFAGTLGPLTVVAGGNGVGKTSMRKAIEFLFTGDRSDAGRTKEDMALLLHGGAESGSVRALVDGMELARDVATGKSIGGSFEMPLALPYLLRADSFCKPGVDRRSFLYGLMGLSTSVEEIIKRLLEKGVDKAKINAVKHLIGSGIFAPALAEAERIRQRDKGAWCEVTGKRSYGKNIAEELPAPTPLDDDAEYKQLEEDIPLWGQITEAKNQLLGQRTAILERKARVPDLRKTGATFAAEQEALNRLEAEHREASSELAGLSLQDRPSEPQQGLPGIGDQPRTAPPGSATDLKPGVEQPPNVYHCPACEARLVYKLGALHPAPSEKELAAMAAAVTQQAQTKTRSRSGGKPAVSESTQAPAAAVTAAPVVEPNALRRNELLQKIAQLEEDIPLKRVAVTKANNAVALADEIEKDVITPAMEAAAGDLDEAKKELQNCTSIKASLDAVRSTAVEAKRKYDRARELHLSIQALDALILQLGPNGIQADILAQAFGPLDAALQDAATRTGWPKPVMGQDMEVHAGGHHYHMLSESYQWRCDIMFAVALAQVSGINFVLADRVDVLDLASRTTCLNWLLDLCLDSGLQAVVFGTLKSVPKGIDGLKGYWLGPVAIAATP